MSELDRIFKRIEKKENVELSKEQIELTMAQDIAKVAGALGGAVKKLEASNKSLEKAKAMKQKAMDDADDANDKGLEAWHTAGDVRNDAVAVLNKAEAAAKDLGVNPSDMKGFKEANDAFSKVDSLSDSNDSLRNELRDIR